MTHSDLPPRWLKKVVEWIRTYADDSREQFAEIDFPHSHRVDMIFDDGSRASFRRAILIEAPELDEIGVFTYRCGYHIFPLAGTHVARVES